MKRKNLFSRPGLFRLAKWVGVIVVSAFLSFLLLNLVFPLPDKITYSTVITDNRGQVIHAYLTPDEKWRMKTELTEISPLLRKTIIAKEDKHFLQTYWRKSTFSCKGFI